MTQVTIQDVKTDNVGHNAEFVGLSSFSGLGFVELVLFEFEHPVTLSHGSQSHFIEHDLP